MRSEKLQTNIWIRLKNKIIICYLFVFGGNNLKKILFCASRVSHIVNFHMPYIKYFHDKGYETDIAAQGSIKSEFISECHDIKFTKNPFSPNNISAVIKLRKIIKKREYDIICSNTTLAGTAAKIAAANLIKKPYFVHISHGYMFEEKGGLKSKIYKLIEKITSKSVDSLVVMNHEDFDLAKKNCLGKNLHYIYGMGLDDKKFPEISAKKRDEIRKNLGIKNGGRLIICVGEFSERKNQKDIIMAFSEVHKSNKNTLLVFAGDGGKISECKELCKKNCIENNTVFLGQYDDMNGLYRSADILVSASKMEGLPFNVMEAMYCGLPVIASKIKGHVDLLKDGGGIMFEKGNIKELSRILGKVLEDENLYNELCKGALLDEKYLLKNAMPQLLKILENTEV